MSREISYTIQIGTAFDGGQDLIWSLVGQESLREKNVIVKRPRFFRKKLAELADAFEGAPAGPDDLNEMFSVDQVDPETDLHFVLKVNELMQPAQNFCPAGDWFYGLGQNAAKYRGVLTPSPVTFLISLRNPAIMLSDAYDSNAYPGLDVVLPDPFQLSWATVLQDLRTHCPDVPIIAWSAEQAPVIWGRVLQAVVGSDIALTDEAKTHIARNLLNEEGVKRLETYLASNAEMPEHLREDVFGIFLKYFQKEDEMETDIAIPDWTEELQARIEDHYAADLDAVRQIEGVTLIEA